MTEKTIHDMYPICSSLVSPENWAAVVAECYCGADPEMLENHILKINRPGLPAFLYDLVRLETALASLSETPCSSFAKVRSLTVNPSLHLIPCSWKNLPSLLQKEHGAAKPEKGSELILVWKDHATGKNQVSAASDDDLLAMKIVVENLDRDVVAWKGGLAVGVIDRIIERAVEKGLLLRPPSFIRRDLNVIPGAFHDQDRFLSTDVFTLQWHITQVCDLHCRHCYDRSYRQNLREDQAVKILDDLRAFSLKSNVSGAVSFTGGNPFLHPDFMKIYRYAAERGFSTAILGNPVPRLRLEEVIAIQRPAFFQVSLEGLPAHNDHIRGPGHFDRATGFLKILRDLGIRSSVMLTLTEANMDQIVPLAEMLRGLADDFFFNRLSMVGEGINLKLPEPNAYRKFLYNYLEAVRDNPVLGLKDNLLNLARFERGEELFGGCTGYGCGAAFNFVAVLPDGEVHACRKFPSYIGNIYHQTLRDIYDSDEAQRYRQGCSVCTNCRIRPVCGGCLAVASSSGVNPFEHRDPFCFISSVLCRQ